VDAGSGVALSGGRPSLGSEWRRRFSLIQRHFSHSRVRAPADRLLRQRQSPKKRDEPEPPRRVGLSGFSQVLCLPRRERDQKIASMTLVSIIMPTFNRADTIKRAIRSVQAQTFTDWELIVVDDGSTDDTAARIEGCDPRLKLIRQENQGTAGARNTGLRASAGS